MSWEMNPSGTMTVVKADDAVFKKPRPPKRKVLDEDSYLAEVEKIIVRDFYPDLEKLRAQKEYLEAVERKDIDKLRELAAKYTPKTNSRSQTPAFGGAAASGSGVTPNSFDTPTPSGQGSRRPSTGPTRRVGTEELIQEMDKEKESSSTKEEKKKESKGGGEEKGEVITGLDAYMLKHTSEDNASFEEIVEEGEKKRRIKWWWLHEAEEKAKESSKDLALEWRKALEGGCSNLVNSDNRPNQIELWSGYQARNAVMYIPEGEGSVAEDKPSKPREIVHSNTRLEISPFDEGKQAVAIANKAAANMQAKTGKIDVEGREVAAEETPQVNGYSFVATPSPMPGVEESPFMTWGEIEGTPFRLDASDTPIPKTPGPAFVIPSVPTRDKLAFDLAERHSKSHRARKEKAINQIKSHPSQQSPFAGRLATLSPAAQRLVDKQPGLGIRKSSDRALHASYTPSPSRISGDRTPVHLGSARSKGSLTPRTPTSLRTPSSSSSTPSSSSATTPSKKKTIIASFGSLTRNKAPTPTPAQTQTKSLTDGLDLKIPSRKKASDFF